MASEWDVVGEQGGEWAVADEKPIASASGASASGARAAAAARAPKIPGMERLGALPGAARPKLDMRPSPLAPAGSLPRQRTGDALTNAYAGLTDVDEAGYASLGGFMAEGSDQARRGASRLARREGNWKDNVSDVLEGGGKAVAPLALPLLAAGAPAALGIGMAEGVALQKGGEFTARALGGDESTQRLAGNIAGSVSLVDTGRRLLRSSGLPSPRSLEAPPIASAAPAVPVPVDAGPVPKGMNRAEESARVFMAEPPKPAAQSAAVFAQEFPPVVKPAAESARVFDDHLGVIERGIKRGVDEWRNENIPRPYNQPVRKGLAHPAREAAEVLARPESPLPIEPPNGGQVDAEVPGTRARRAGERGSFSLKPINQPNTPAEKYALDMIAAREAARPKEPSLLARLGAVKDEAKRKMVDSTAPILDTLARSQRENKYEIRPTEDVGPQIDRALRAPSLAHQFMDDNGLFKVIRDVDRLEYLDQYLIAKHARHIDADKATGRDEVMDAALIQEFAPRYEPFAKQVKAYSEKLLDYVTDSGLIDNDLAKYLKERYPEYVPLKRIMDAVDDVKKVQPSGVASLSQQSVVQRLKGSEREIENPFSSLVEKTYDAFAQGERNKAARMLAGYRDLPGFADLIKPVAGDVGNKPHFSYLDGGRKVTFETTPEIAAAARSLDKEQLGFVGKLFAAPARVAKVGITGINLPFVLANMASDVMFNAVTAKHAGTVANPMVYLKALMEATKHGELHAEMVRSGAGFTSFDLLRSQPRKGIEKIRAGRSAEDRLGYIVMHPIESVADAFRATENFVGRSEEFGRMRLFEGTRRVAQKQGRTAADTAILAQKETNNASPNYLRAGDWGRAMNGVFLYLNAGIQGSRSFLRAADAAARGGPAEQAKFASKVALGLFTPVAAATLWNLSDPERAKVYADIAEYEKENNIIVVRGKSEKDSQGRYDVFKVKLPPGLGKLASVPRRGIEAAHGMDPASVGDMAKYLVGTVSPIGADPKEALSTAIPQAIKPTVQATANYDFFRERPKVPRRLEQLPPEMQVQPYTSGTAKKIAGAMGASPIKTEEFLKDSLGGVASQVLNASDNVLAVSGVIPRSDIGGTALVDAVTARFSKARGGEIDARERAAQDELEDMAVRFAAARAEQTPAYRREADERRKQEIVDRAANSMRQRIARMFSERRFRALPHERKMARFAAVRQQIERRRAAPSRQ